ncbi:MAG: sigma-54 dependent transcriptional regulator [Chitinophagaceae bacterium]
MVEKKILVVDDDIDMCALLQRFLSKNGYVVDTATSGHKGIEKFKEGMHPLVLCDYRLGDKEGRDVLKEIKTLSPGSKVIIITGYSDIKTAVEVIKMGAFDYITKPLIPDEVLNVLNKAMQQPAPASVVAPPSTAPRNPGVNGLRPSQYMVGTDAVTKELYNQIQLVAPTNYSIILYGESGTGKEVIAKTIHENSNRAEMPFLAVDCGTLTKELAGSELFGHEKGSFTGAVGSKEGFFEVANGGTLFLDEVANLGIDIQATLLRVIQERKFKRVGGNKEMPVDVRVIVASNENLKDAYQKGRFREDLFHRFNEFSIHIPPLRHREADITSFANYFLDITNEELSKTVADFSDEAMELLLQYPWPGNIRELRNVVRRAVLLTPGKVIEAKVLPPEIIHNSRIMQTPVNDSPMQRSFVSDKDPNLKNAATQAEYETIMKVLQQVKYNKTKAAEILQIDRKTLYNKIRGFEEQLASSSQGG